MQELMLVIMTDLFDEIFELVEFKIILFEAVILEKLEAMILELELLNISLLKPDKIEYLLPIILLKLPEIITFPTEHCLAIDEFVIILLLIPDRIAELTICCRPLKVFDIIIRL
jgi:hypothetical protein